MLATAAAAAAAIWVTTAWLLEVADGGFGLQQAGLAWAAVDHMEGVVERRISTSLGASRVRVFGGVVAAGGAGNECGGEPLNGREQSERFERIRGWARS